MHNEFERKFTFKAGMQGATELLNKQANVKESKIEQYYFFEDTSIIRFDLIKKQWIITFKNILSNKDCQSMSINIEPEHFNEIKGIIEGENRCNLLSIKGSSFRFRFKSNKWLFTAKFKPHYEFEYIIKPKPVFLNKVKCLCGKILKKRCSFLLLGYIAELDFFESKNEPILEFEFPTEEEMKVFRPEGLNVIERSGIREYTNKYIAKQNKEIKEKDLA